MSSSDGIQTLIFDLGGVYFADGTKRAINVLSARFNLDPKQVSEQLIGKPGSDWRMGQLTGEEFWAQFKAGWSLSVSSAELARIWFEGYEIDRATENVVSTLSRAGYEVLYLSDNVPERVAYLQERYHFLEKFANGVFSYQIGVRKPDVAMYRSAMEKSSSPAAKCVYIDNIPAFLEPAAALGMKTIHFRSADQLIADLVKLGVSLDSESIPDL
jgi:FMN phosphatase YigB (HAD superfamily)